MKRDYFLTFLLCGGLLLSMLTGCKSSKKVGTVESASVKAHNEFFQSVEDQSFQFRTLTARLNVDLDIPGKQMSSRVDMKMVKDSAVGTTFSRDRDLPYRVEPGYDQGGRPHE